MSDQTCKTCQHYSPEFKRAPNKPATHRWLGMGGCWVAWDGKPVKDDSTACGMWKPRIEKGEADNASTV